MWTYLIGPFLSLLPARWRTAYFRELPVDWPRATAVSGLVEGFAALLALVVWYSVFVTKYGGVIGRTGCGDYCGFVSLCLLALHPLTWVICYFGCEGAVRFLGALATGECYGTLPLALAARIGTAKRSARGELLLDEITVNVGAYDLQIATSRPKDHWKYPLTIRYQEQFYQAMKDEFRAGDARPYVYLLRRLPANEIIKGLEPYDPADVELEETPGFFQTVFSEMRRRAWK